VGNVEDGPPTIVVDVRTNARGLARRLESLAFVPTVYCPGLVANGFMRFDAIQYTRVERPNDASIVCLDWESAAPVIATVAESVAKLAHLRR
jgi:hypothetical protein